MQTYTQDLRLYTLLQIALIKPQYFSIAGHSTVKFVLSKSKDQRKDDYYPRCIMVTQDNIVSGARQLAAGIELKVINQLLHCV